MRLCDYSIAPPASTAAQHRMCVDFSITRFSLRFTWSTRTSPTPILPRGSPPFRAWGGRPNLDPYRRRGDLRRALDAGASGYLLKDMRAEELADAVRRVQQGLRVIDPELATEAWGEPDPLTDRERQVLRLAGDGKASGDIAVDLNLSEGTVRNYLSEAISKLGASNRVEAARIARTKGWL